MSERPGFPPRLAVIIGVIAVSTASLIIRLSSSPALAIAAYRLVFATMLLLPAFALTAARTGLRELVQGQLMTQVIAGLVLAVHFGTWITSVKLTSVASSVILVNAAPVFVAVLSHFWLREKVSPKGWAGTVIAFAGVIAIAMSDVGTGEENLLGDTLALIGAVALALYLLTGRRLRQRLSLFLYVVPVYAVSALVLILVCVGTGVPLQGYSVHELLLFLLLAVVPMILGHTVYNWALKYVQAPTVSVSLLGEPLGAVLLAAVFLGEVPKTLTLVGGAVVLTGIYLVSSGSRS